MSQFSSAFPQSQKVFVEASQGVHVPMREIALEQGRSSVRVYDTSGPQGHDVRDGLPKLRQPWVDARLDAGARRIASDGPPRSPDARPTRVVTQLHYARKGEI